MMLNLYVFMIEGYNGLDLNRNGHEVLFNQHNFSSEVYNDIEYGGVKRLKYQFNKKQNKLIKTIYNAN